MAATIDDTAKGTNANSFVSLTEFNAFLDEQLNNGAAATATDDDKKRALIMAARQIEQFVDWDLDRIGHSRTTITQSRMFPRIGTYNLEGDDWLSQDVNPEFAKRAQMQQARFNLLSDRNADASARGIKRVKADTVEVEFDGEVSNSTQVLANAVWAEVAAWALGGGPGSDFNVIELERVG